MKRHVSLLVTGVSAGKNVARPWYDDFWGRRGQSGPSPRLVQSKWRRTQARWLDHLTLRWQSLRLLVAVSRRGNAWVTHPWKSGKSRDTVDTPWPRLKSWLAGETESWKYNRPRAAFATDVTRARDRTRDSPESTYDALQPRVDGPVLIRAWIRYAPFFSPLEREFHFGTRGYFYV